MSSLAGRSGFLCGLVLRLGLGGIAKSWSALRVRRRPRHRAGRFVDILSKSVVVTEVDEIDPLLTMTVTGVSNFYSGLTRGKIQEGRNVEENANQNQMPRIVQNSFSFVGWAPSNHKNSRHKSENTSFFQNIIQSFKNRCQKFENSVQIGGSGTSQIKKRTK